MTVAHDCVFRKQAEDAIEEQKHRDHLQQRMKALLSLKKNIDSTQVLVTLALHFTLLCCCVALAEHTKGTANAAARAQETKSTKEQAGEGEDSKDGR